MNAIIRNILERSNSLSAAKLAWLLAIVAILLYGNTMLNGYALDDLAAVTNNTYVTKGIKGIPGLLQTPYHKGFQLAASTSDNLYRPISLVSLAVEYQFFKESPLVSHAVNVLLFAGCVVLLFLFLRRLLGNAMLPVAFMAALLFAVHPIHTEVVANIKSRDELMCFLFAMLSLLCYARYASSGRVVQLSVGAFSLFLSLLSKETSVSFLLVIPLIFFGYINHDKKRSILITILSLVAVATFVAIRFAVIDPAATNIEFLDNQLIGAPSMASRIATAIFMLGYYIRLLFIPYPLVCDYSFESIPFVQPGNVWVVLSAAIYLALAVYGSYRLRRYHRDPWAFGILFFLITIALFSNILFLLGATMAERFVFFPSVGFCMLIALLLSAWGNRQGRDNKKAQLRIWAILALVCIICSACTILRNTDWKDNLTLFNADVTTSPRDARLWYYLGFETKTQADRSAADPLKQAQLYEESIVYFDSSIAIYPRYKNARKDLAGVFIQLQRYDLAEEQFKAILSLHASDSSTAISDMGYIYFLNRKYPDAIAMCQRALHADARNIITYYNLAVCYLQVGKFDSAIFTTQQGLLQDSANTTLKATLQAAYRTRFLADSLSGHAH